MTKVTLMRKSLNGDAEETIIGSFSNEDLSILRAYVNSIARVKACSLLQRGIPNITGGHFRGGKIELECGSFTDAELHELLHVLRLVILRREPASFDSVSALLRRRFENRGFSDHLKALRQIYDHGELHAFMQISIGGQPLFHSSILDIWLNSTQYHSDQEKLAAWQKLESALDEPSTRALLLHQLRGKIISAIELEEIVNVVLSPD